MKNEDEHSIETVYYIHLKPVALSDKKCNDPQKNLGGYWVSEASHTLAVQSRFRVIYICMYVGVCRFVYKKYVCQNAWAK